MNVSPKKGPAAPSQAWPGSTQRVSDLPGDPASHAGRGSTAAEAKQSQTNRSKSEMPGSATPWVAGPAMTEEVGGRPDNDEANEWPPTQHQT